MIEDEKNGALQERKPEITLGHVTPSGLIPSNFEAMYRMAKIMSASGLMPKGIETPEAVFVAVQMGLEVGLSPMQAVQNIAVINGRPAIWGDSVLGLVRASGELETFDESLVGEYPTDDFTAVCVAKRKGYEKEIRREFSIADAKLAGLWCYGTNDSRLKLTPWYKYPKRMLQMRSRSWALRDGFGDILKGLRMAEEIQSYDVEMVPSSAEPGAIPQYETSVSTVKSKTEAKTEALKKARSDNGVLSEAEKDQLLKNEIEPMSPWDRDTWINLRKAGFSTHFYKHRSSFSDASDEIKQEVVGKWRGLYPDSSMPEELQAAVPQPEKTSAMYTPADPQENNIENGLKVFDALAKAIEVAGEDVVKQAEKQTGFVRDTPSQAEADILTKRIGTLMDMDLQF